MRLWIATVIYLFFLFSSNQLIRSQHYSEETTEIQSCLSPDLEEEEREACRFYAAVIDAGSTGTRIHLFEFSHNINLRHSPFLLESETFKEVKPGLSSFAKMSTLAAESVEDLLQTAKAVVPKNLWHHTPITLKATAGLRLLPQEEANEIIFQVDKAVTESGFLVDEDSVGILSGVDEGVFGWFTLNYLLGRLSGNRIQFTNTGAALDLGGGSTQLTFVPADFSLTLGDLPRENFTHKLRLFGNDVNFFTHSYLGNGLIAARLGIARLTTQGYRAATAEVEHNVLFTDCLPSGFQLDDWDYAGNIWTVRSTGSGGFAKCLESARQYVQDVTKVVAIRTLNNCELFAFSYFRDRGHQAGLFALNNGQIRVDDYKKAAQKACALRAAEIGTEHWQPWQCLDLVYIYALLRYGYGLLDEKNLQLTKRLKNKEVSWALGAGFHLLNTYHDKSRRESSMAKNNKLCNDFSVGDAGAGSSQTCSMLGWYLRVGDRNCDDGENCDISMKNASLDEQRRQQQRSSCIFAQLREYIRDAASHILIFLKLAS